MKRLALTLAAALVCVLAAAPAFGDTPAIMISTITMTPGSETPATVDQIITFSNMEPGTALTFMVAPELGYTSIHSDSGSPCQDNGVGYQGTCFVSGSGTIRVTYTPRLATSLFTFQLLRVWTGSLQATGQINIEPRSDVGVSVATPDTHTIQITVFNLGPSRVSSPDVDGEQLAISGFAGTVTLPTSKPCQSGPIVYCQAPGLPAGPPLGGQPCAQPSCAVITLTLSDWPVRRLKITVSGGIDHNQSNNTAIAFPDAPAASTGGGGGGTNPLTRLGNLPTGGASGEPQSTDPATTDPAPSPTVEVAAGPVMPDPDHVEGSSSMTGPLLAGIAVLVLLAGGGAAALVWHRVRRRRAQPTDPPDPTIVLR